MYFLALGKLLMRLFKKSEQLFRYRKIAMRSDKIVSASQTN